MNIETFVRELGPLNIRDNAVSIGYLRKCQTKKFLKGQLIYKIGEIADAVYVIISGKVKIFYINESGEELLVAEKKTKEYFGADALITFMPCTRFSTARATEDSECLVLLKHELYKEFETPAEISKLTETMGSDNLYKELEQSFKDLQQNKIDLSNIHEKKAKYLDRQVIFFQNEKPLYAYIIVSGQVDIRSDTLNEKEGFNSTLEKGEIFGELGLLKDRPRAAMAVSRGNSELMLLDKETLLRLYGSNANFKNIITTLGNTYNLPLNGRTIRYEGVFLGMKAICVKMEPSKEKTVVSYQVVGKDIFCISQLGIEGYQTYIYKKNLEERKEIWIKNDLLVGVVNYGSKDDNSALVVMVLQETKVSNNAIMIFQKTGIFTEQAAQPLKVLNNLLCRCMQVEYQTVAQAIQSGENSLEQITKITGAGSVCGSCRPKIKEMLGKD